MAAVTAASIGLLLVGGFAAAQAPASARLPFGMIGVTPEQTARVNVVALDLPPSPCQVALSFFDDRGSLVLMRGGEALESGNRPAFHGVARRSVTLASAGESAFLDLPGSAILGGTAGRPIQVRAAVELATPYDCSRARLVTTVEVLQSKGASAILYANPPDVVAAADGSATIAFGMVGITREQTARLSVVALQAPPSPCRVRLSFFDDHGALVTATGGARSGPPAQRVVTLESQGDSATLELAGLEFASLAPANGPARIRAYAEVPPSPCAGGWIVPTLQVAGADGATSLLYAAPAVLTDPCAGRPDGSYCSLELNQPGDPSARYFCQGGKALSQSVCAAGCENGTCIDPGGGSSF